MEDITPELEEQANTDPNLREKQMNSIVESLKVSKELVEKDETGVLADAHVKLVECKDFYAALRSRINQEREEEYLSAYDQVSWLEARYSYLTKLAENNNNEALSHEGGRFVKQVDLTIESLKKLSIA